MVSNKKNSNNKMDSKDEEDDIPKITPLYSKILVTTDKNWDNKVVIRSTLEEISQQIGCIILREGRGTKCIRPVCYKFGIRNISYIADWAKFGYKAGVLRNEEMIEKGNPSLVIIFHNWIEYGTGIDHLIFLCKKTRIPYLIYSEHNSSFLVECRGCGDYFNIEEVNDYREYCDSTCHLKVHIAPYEEMLEELGIMKWVDEEDSATNKICPDIDRAKQVVRNSYDVKLQEKLSSSIKFATESSSDRETKYITKELSKLAYAEKRRNLKNMTTAELEDSDSDSEECTFLKKNGKKCTNQRMAGTKYCGISSHSSHKIKECPSRTRLRKRLGIPQ